jgi:hypothetical protein
VLQDHRQAAASAAMEEEARATLLQAMELRIGIQAPPELLSGRLEYLQQAEIAGKMWAQFEAAAEAAGAAADSRHGKPLGAAAAGDTLGAAARFDEAAHGVYKGLLAAVMLLNSAAHQFQHGLEDATRRRSDLVGGRARIREAQVRDTRQPAHALASRLGAAGVRRACAMPCVCVPSVRVCRRSCARSAAWSRGSPRPMACWQRAAAPWKATRSMRGAQCSPRPPACASDASSPSVRVNTSPTSAALPPPLPPRFPAALRSRLLQAALSALAFLASLAARTCSWPPAAPCPHSLAAHTAS